MEGEEPTDPELCANGHADVVEIGWHDAYLSTEYLCLACKEGWLVAYY